MVTSECFTTMLSRPHFHFAIILSTVFHYGDMPMQYEPRREKTVFFAYAKTKTQISFVVTAKLISTFVYATCIVQSLNYLNPKFQASSYLLWLYSPVCGGPGRKPRRPVFSERGSYRCTTTCFFFLTFTSTSSPKGNVRSPENKHF